jgi:hypothetical protein
MICDKCNTEVWDLVSDNRGRPIIPMTLWTKIPHSVHKNKKDIRPQYWCYTCAPQGRQ